MGRTNFGPAVLDLPYFFEDPGETKGSYVVGVIHESPNQWRGSGGIGPSNSINGGTSFTASVEHGEARLSCPVKGNGSSIGVQRT